MFKYSTNATSEGSWYLILDDSWPYYLAEQDCYKRLAMAKLDSKIQYYISPALLHSLDICMLYYYHI